MAAATLGLLVFVTLPDRDAGSTTSTAPAPLLSEFEATAVNLTTTPDPTQVERWKDINVTDAGTTVMYDMALSQGSLIAVGAEGREPQVWISVNGLAWRPVATLETSEDDSSFAFGAVLEWQGGTIAVGLSGERPGIWFSTEPDTWDYYGTIDGFPEGQFPAVAAGPEILALAPSDTGYAGWASSDLAEWVPLGELSGLEDLLLGSLNYHQGWYYALGTVDSGDGGRRAAIYRSDDGVNWTETGTPDGGPLSNHFGEVHDMVATDDGFLAIGSTVFGDEQLPAMWKSIDGASWWPQPAHGALSTHATHLGLAAIDLGTPNRATLVVDGEEHTVVEDSMLATDAGVVHVTDVAETRVGLDVDGTPYVLNVGSTGTIQRVPSLRHLAAQEERVVVVGTYGPTSTLAQLTPTPPSPVGVVWTSVDGGDSWERSLMSGDDSAARHVGLIGNNIAVIGQLNSRAAAWHTYWNTDALEAAAIDAAHGFMAAITAGDLARVLPLLPIGTWPHNEMQLPALGGVDLGSWYTEGGDIRLEAVSDTLTYMSTLNTAITIGDCSSIVRPAEIETVRVTCDFSVTSDLMRALGVPEGLGRFEATYEAEKLTSLAVPVAPSLSAWQALSDWAIDDGIATAGIIGVDGKWEEDPVFTRESAAVHLDLAEKVTATLLLPGGTRVTHTPFGPMEWRWLETLPGDLGLVESVAHTDLGFIAVGRETNNSGQSSVWQSDDGLNWSPLPAPDVNSLWSPIPFRGGLIAIARHEKPALVLFDGSTWSEVPIPHAEDNQQSVYLVPNGDEALVVTSRWTTDDTPPTFELWKLSANDTMSPVLDPWTDESPWPIGFAPLGDGYIVATTAEPPSAEVTFLYTDDGTSWTQLADTTSIPDAAYVWHLAKHGEKLLLFGQLDETRCTNDGRGQDCDEVSGLWTSVDGYSWEPAGAGPEGPIGSFTVGSGPLGLIAVGQPPFDADLPQPIYLSTDGTDWVRAPGFSLYEPETSWSWGNIPAVSDDTIIVPRVSFYEGGPASSIQNEHHWLIIGKLIDQ